MIENTPSPSPRILSVTELNRLVRDVLERNFPLFWVSGEISNLTRAASGHWYFSLKDSSAQVRCVMFRGRNSYLDWQPKEGDKVEARALVSLYEARGEFQLTIEFLQRAGLGALFEAYERLKAKLQAEGLFAAAKKQAIPSHPRQIGIITSADAAALRDVLSTLQRRMPAIPVVIYPTQVQGKTAAAQIASAIRTASERDECDVLILCRGGGSIEDLWSFNEEIVARAIADCHIPLISGVGHETDFTIADFVADVRAPTPTAAAELVTPDRNALLRNLAHYQQQLARHMQFKLHNTMQLIDYLSKRIISPTQQIAQKKQHLQQLHYRLNSLMQNQLKQPQLQNLNLALSMQQFLLSQQQKLKQLQQSLNHLNPNAILQRGYALVHNAQGQLIASSQQLQTGENIKISLGEGSVGAEVNEVNQQKRG
jgi:exodeoxyribonuclease VII large subunit